MIDRDAQRTILRHLLSHLPEDQALLVLGNTGSIVHGVADITSTKDVDVALIVVTPDRRVAGYDVLRALVDALEAKPDRAPEDRSWLKVAVTVGDVTRNVDFIRGRTRDRPQGTFLVRDVLEAVAQRADLDGRLLVPDPTDLVVMKAWAAVDQERHLAQTGESEFHRERLRAYLDDARRIADFALRRGGVDRARIEGLLKMMKPHRRRPVRAVLERVGVVD